MKVKPMAKRKNESTVDLTAQSERLAGKLHFYGVIFRVALIAGLVLLVVIIGLLIFSELISFWVIIFPLVLIAFGVILARVEYRLHLRLFQLTDQNPVDKMD
jgi:hypothetical protein